MTNITRDFSYSAAFIMGLLNTWRRAVQVESPLIVNCQLSDSNNSTHRALIKVNEPSFCSHPPGELILGSYIIKIYSVLVGVFCFAIGVFRYPGFSMRAP